MKAEDVLAWRDHASKAMSSDGSCTITKATDNGSPEPGRVARNSQSDTTKARPMRWNRVVTESFLKALIQETQRGRDFDDMEPAELRQVMCDIIPRLRERYPGLPLTLSNTTSKYHHIWTQYRNILAVFDYVGTTYDDATGKIDASHAVWTEFLAQFPSMARVRRRGMPFVQSLMAKVWPGTTPNSRGMFESQDRGTSDDSDSSDEPDEESIVLGAVTNHVLGFLRRQVMPKPRAPTTLNRVVSGRVEKKAQARPLRIEEPKTVPSTVDPSLARDFEALDRWLRRRPCDQNGWKMNMAIKTIQKEFGTELGTGDVKLIAEMFAGDPDELSVFVALSSREARVAFLKGYAWLLSPSEEGAMNGV